MTTPIVEARALRKTYDTGAVRVEALRGIDLVLELSRLSPPPKVIAISGVTGKAFLDAAAEANVARTFVKPFDVMEVARAVTQLAGA